jgi:hypothetical protein
LELRRTFVDMSWAPHRSFKEGREEEGQHYAYERPAMTFGF